MFAGVTKTDAQAVVADDVIIQRADISELIGERWRRLGDSALQTPSDLARQPGFSLRAAADHHGIRPRPFKRRHRLLVRGDVAVDDKRNADRVLDRAHRVPVRLALVELASGPAMDGPDASSTRAR